MTVVEAVCSLGQQPDSNHKPPGRTRRHQDVGQEFVIVRLAEDNACYARYATSRPWRSPKTAASRSHAANSQLSFLRRIPRSEGGTLLEWLRRCGGRTGNIGDRVWGVTELCRYQRIHLLTPENGWTCSSTTGAWNKTEQTAGATYIKNTKSCCFESPGHDRFLLPSVVHPITLSSI